MWPNTSIMMFSRSVESKRWIHGLALVAFLVTIVLVAVFDDLSMVQGHETSKISEHHVESVKEERTLVKRDVTTTTKKPKNSTTTSKSVKTTTSKSPNKTTTSKSDKTTTTKSPSKTTTRKRKTTTKSSKTSTTGKGKRSTSTTKKPNKTSTTKASNGTTRKPQNSTTEKPITTRPPRPSLKPWLRNRLELEEARVIHEIELYMGKWARILKRTNGYTLNPALAGGYLTMRTQIDQVLQTRKNKHRFFGFGPPEFPLGLVEYQDGVSDRMGGEEARSKSHYSPYPLDDEYNKLDEYASNEFGSM